MKKNHKTEDDELRIISTSINKLLMLDEKEKKIHRAQKAEIETIQNITDRFCDDRHFKEKLAKNEEASQLLQQAKDLISTLRILLK